MKKIQEDKLSALLDLLPTSVKRAFMSKTEKQKDIDMTDARDAYYDLPKHIRAKIDAMIDPDTGRVKAGANSEELEESLVSDVNDDGYKTWKYTDSNGKEYRAYGKNENGAKDYLTLRYELKDVDTSKIELTRRGVGYVDPYLEAIYKGTTDTIVKKELPLFTTETKNKTKMNKKDLMEMIREVIAEEMGSNATDVGNYKVMIDRSLIHGLSVPAKVVMDIKGLRKGKELNDKLGKSLFNEDEYYEVRTQEQVLRNDDGTERTINTLTIFSRGDGKIEENKMKVNQLRQIIREEISKVLNEQRKDELEIYGDNKDFFRGDSGDASEIARELANNGNYTTTIPKKELIDTLSNYDGLEDAIQVVNSIEGDILNFSREEIWYGGPKSIKISPLRKSSPMNPDIQKFKDTQFGLNYPNRGLDPMSSD